MLNIDWSLTWSLRMGFSIDQNMVQWQQSQNSNSQHKKTSLASYCNHLRCRWLYYPDTIEVSRYDVLATNVFCFWLSIWHCFIKSDNAMYANFSLQSERFIWNIHLLGICSQADFHLSETWLIPLLCWSKLNCCIWPTHVFPFQVEFRLSHASLTRI